MWKMFFLKSVVIAMSVTAYSEVALAHGGNGGTPTTEPPEMSNCDNGILSIDVGEPWETAPRTFSIEVDIIDFTDSEIQYVVLEKATNAEITIADGPALTVGEKFQVPAGKTVSGTVFLVESGNGSFTLVSFGEEETKCEKKVDLES